MNRQTPQIDEQTLEQLRQLQLHLAAVVGAYWMLVFTIFMCVLCCGAFALKFRRSGFVCFGIMAVSIFFIPSLISMFAGPCLMALAIYGLVREPVKEPTTS